MDWQGSGLTSGMVAIKRDLEDLRRELANAIERLEHRLDQLSIDATRPPSWNASLSADVAGLRGRLNAVEDRVNRLESWRWNVEARLFKDDMDAMRT